MTSYSFSQRVDAQVILWAIGGALCRLWAALRAVVLVLAAAEPYLLGAFVGMAAGLFLFAGVSALASMIPATFWLGLAITGVLAYVGYPRTAVRK